MTNDRVFRFDPNNAPTKTCRVRRIPPQLANAADLVLQVARLNTNMAELSATLSLCSPRARARAPEAWVRHRFGHDRPRQIKLDKFSRLS
jgi:hypothetical protein